MLSSEWRMEAGHWPGPDPEARALCHAAWVLCCRHWGVGTGWLTRLLHLLFCLSAFRGKCMHQSVSMCPGEGGQSRALAERSVGTLPPKSVTPWLSNRATKRALMCLLHACRVPPTPRLSHEVSYQVQKLHKAQCYECIFIFGD